MDALNDLIRAFDFKTDNHSQPLPNRPNPKNSGSQFGQFHLTVGRSWTRLVRNWGDFYRSGYS